MFQKAGIHVCSGATEADNSETNRSHSLPVASAVPSDDLGKEYCGIQLCASRDENPCREPPQHHEQLAGLSVRRTIIMELRGDGAVGLIVNLTAKPSGSDACGPSARQSCCFADHGRCLRWATAPLPIRPRPPTRAGFGINATETHPPSDHGIFIRIDPIFFFYGKSLGFSRVG